MPRALSLCLLATLLYACSNSAPDDAATDEAPTAEAAEEAPTASPEPEAAPPAAPPAEPDPNAVALLRVAPELVLMEESSSVRLIAFAENAAGELLPDAPIRFSSRSRLVSVSDDGTITSVAARGPAFVEVAVGGLVKEVPVRVVGEGEMPEVYAPTAEGSGGNVLGPNTTIEDATRVVFDTLRGSWDLALEGDQVATVSFARDGQFEQILPDGTTMTGEWGVSSAGGGSLGAGATEPELGASPGSSGERPRLWWNARSDELIESRAGTCTDVRPRRVDCGDIVLRRIR